jgi:hypothetical protein
MEPSRREELNVTTGTTQRHDKADFAAQVGSTFAITVDGGAMVAAELLDVTDGPSSPNTEQFALHFRLPAELPPLQRMYDITHDVLGPVPLFLVPIGRDAAGLYLEAVFNRRTAPPEG